MKPSLSIGIEEEYQTIDPETRDLRSHIGMEMIEKGRAVLTERVKPEMHQSVIEAGTRVCRNIQEATHEIHMIRRCLIDLAKQNGLRLAASASHPFAEWSEQGIYPDERYHTIVEDMQMVARANLIFGLHVHIGVEDPETAIHIMNAARYFLPHILALSTNSPFWQNMDTGLKSYRCKVFDKFPRTNIPDYFPSYGEYESFINLLIKTNCIDNALVFAPTSRITSPVTANTRASSTCSSRPIASITPRKSGGISARIPISARSNSACATSPCAPRKPSRSPRSSRPPWPSSTSCTP